MKSSARIVVARRGGRDEVVDRRAEAPFSVRCCNGRVLLAASAAGPVGGDELDLSVTVGPGATADIGSVAANMVWPGVDGSASSTRTDCDVGVGGTVMLHPEPTISVVGSRHRVTTRVQLEDAARCRLVEEIVLGRRAEPSGHLELSLRVERRGTPLVHHDEVFGPDAPGAFSSVSVGAARHVVSAVLVGPASGRSRVRVDGARAAAWLPVADDATVVMAVGPDRPSVIELLADIAPELHASPSTAAVSSPVEPTTSGRYG